MIYLESWLKLNDLDIIFVRELEFRQGNQQNYQYYHKPEHDKGIFNTLNGKSQRYRASALVFIDDKLLLVRDRGKRDYSLPGGGYKPKESTIGACPRELREEVGGLFVKSVERLKQYDFHGTRARHKVALIKASGKPYVKSKEIDKVILWDMKENIKVQDHVRRILRCYLGMLKTIQ